MTELVLGNRQAFDCGHLAHSGGRPRGGGGVARSRARLVAATTWRRTGDPGHALTHGAWPAERRGARAASQAVIRALAQACSARPEAVRSRPPTGPFAARGSPADGRNRPEAGRDRPEVTNQRLTGGARSDKRASARACPGASVPRRETRVASGVGRHRRPRSGGRRPRCRDPVPSSLGRSVPDSSGAALIPAFELNVRMTFAPGIDHAAPRHRINRRGVLGHRSSGPEVRRHARPLPLGLPKSFCHPGKPWLIAPRATEPVRRRTEPGPKYWAMTDHPVRVSHRAATAPRATFRVRAMPAALERRERVAPLSSTPLVATQPGAPT